MSNITEEEVKKQIEEEKSYFHSESSTGMNHQVRVVAQNNAIIYLNKNLIKQIDALNKSISEFRAEIANYEKASSKNTQRITLLTIAMAIIAAIQLILFFIQILKVIQ